MSINVSKTKVIIFRRGGILSRNLSFTYHGQPLESVKSFKYLGTDFTAGGSFSEAQTILTGQAQKAIFKFNSYLYKFTSISPKHKLDPFDKLITPILNYSCEVWRFIQANAIETVHLQLCKKLLDVKKSTKNDFVYGKLGRINYISKRYAIIIKSLFKILTAPENKYIKLVYNMMLSDLELFPNKVNLVSLVRHLMSLGFYQVWLNQGVGNISIFISVFKQRLTDIFIQNWQERLGSSSRARFNFFAIFHFQPYLEIINVQKYSQAFSKLRMSSPRLEIESGRWVKPKPLDERNCSVCGVLEDKYHFVIECSMYIELRKKYMYLFITGKGQVCINLSI